MISTETALQLGWEVSQAGRWNIKRTSWPVATWAGVSFTSEADALAEVERRIAGDLRISVGELREQCDAPA